jgi:sensor histidine kinase YesM
MILEVEHDGTMTDADREKIRLLLSGSDTDRGRVGLRNVHQRLKLIYGEVGNLCVAQTDHGTVLARIVFPLEQTRQNRG